MLSFKLWHRHFIVIPTIMNDEERFRLIETIFYFISVFIVACYLPLFVTILVLFPLCLKIYTKLTLGICRSINRLDGNIVIVTGANGGIGLETAKDLARRGAKLILACRNLDTGKQALELIRRETGNPNLRLKQLDLSSLASIRNFAGEIKLEERKVDILINNAGTAITTKIITSDNIEANAQTNHFGPFLLTNLLLDLLTKSPNGKIINLSSDMHKLVRNLDLENLKTGNGWNSNRAWISTMKVYCRTKLANVLLTRELDRKLRDAGINNVFVNAVHPGGVRTDIFRSLNEKWYDRNFGFGMIQTFFFKNPSEGAQTTIHLAVSDETNGVSGKYFADCKKSWITYLANDRELAKKLWEYSAHVVNLKQDETIFS